MTITTLPTPPSRQRPTEFSNEADAFLGALPAFGTEANALAVDVTNKQVTASAAASTATTKASEASSSAASALFSKNAAELAATEASDLTEKYQGALTIDPALSKAGGVITAGDWYVNTTSGFIRAYNGSTWVNSVSAVAGVSSFNGMTGDVVYTVPEVVQLTLPSNVSPNTSTIDVKPGVTLVANRSLSLYGSVVESRFQVSTSADFSSGTSSTAWIPSETSQVNYTLTALDIQEGTVVYYWRVQCRTIVSGDTYMSNSAASTFTTKATFFDSGNTDSLNSLITIQAEYNPATTYSAGAIVIVRKSLIRFIEYKSLVASNTGNNPETSPTKWELIFDNNTETSGYFGEILGSACVVDKGEWLSTTTYSIGDMVVVKNIPTPLKQSDLTAYVALTASNNKNPTNNPSDWQQRNGLPTGTSLADTLGLYATGAVLQNNDTGWLKFVHQGKVKYIAKKSFMHTVSWNDIAKAEAVYGNRTIRIGSNLFRVSILSGAEADPSSWVTTSTATDNKGSGSEWNQLVYRVCSVIPTDGTTTYHGGKQIGSNWKDFSEADLNITGNGGYAWCKETLGFNTASRVLRGYDSLSGFGYGTSSNAATGYGWRPCLTLISEPESDSLLYNAEASGVGPSVVSLQYDPITDTGYYGEVTSAQFYTGTQISTATGVTTGTLQNDTEGWLKFYWHGQVLFISKKTYRYNINWDNINTANSVYGVNLGSTGKKTITHAGSSTNYDVKLMKGATKDPSPASSPGRQWDELLYRVCTGTETGEIGTNWATLTPSTDLGINSGNGSYTWTQEVYQPNTDSRVLRGYDSLSGFGYGTSSNAATGYGWRPCLALAR